MMNRRDDIHKIDPNSYNRLWLNYDTQTHICTDKRKRQRDVVENMEQKSDITKLWRTIKGKAACHQVQSTVQHIKAGQTHFFKLDPISDKRDKEKILKDGTVVHQPEIRAPLQGRGGGCSRFHKSCKTQH